MWNPLEVDYKKKQKSLPGKHWEFVRSLSFSPDGRFLASRDRKGNLKIWSTDKLVKNYIYSVWLLR